MRVVRCYTEYSDRVVPTIVGYSYQALLGGHAAAHGVARCCDLDYAPFETDLLVGLQRELVTYLVVLIIIGYDSQALLGGYAAADRFARCSDLDFALFWKKLLVRQCSVDSKQRLTVIINNY